MCPRFWHHPTRYRTLTQHGIISSRRPPMQNPTRNTNAEIDLQNRNGTIRRGSLARILLLTCLCLSLFAWGIGYKLSLYKASEQTRPSMQSAKLLSQKERPVASTHFQLQAQPGAKGSVLWIAFLVVLFTLSLEHPSATLPALVSVPRELRNPPALYSRPPPSHA